MGGHVVLSEDPTLLRRQAAALLTRVNAQEGLLSELRHQLSGAHRDLAAQGASEIEAQRATNARLTDQIEALESDLSAVLRDWNAIVEASGARTHGGAVGHVGEMRKLLDDIARYESTYHATYHRFVLPLQIRARMRNIIGQQSE